MDNFFTFYNGLRRIEADVPAEITVLSSSVLQRETSAIQKLHSKNAEDKVKQEQVSIQLQQKHKELQAKLRNEEKKLANVMSRFSKVQNEISSRSLRSMDTRHTGDIMKPGKEIESTVESCVQKQEEYRQFSESKIQKIEASFRESEKSYMDLMISARDDFKAFSKIKEVLNDVENRKNVKANLLKSIEELKAKKEETATKKALFQHKLSDFSKEITAMENQREETRNRNVEMRAEIVQLQNKTASDAPLEKELESRAAYKEMRLREMLTKIEETRAKAQKEENEFKERMEKIHAHINAKKQEIRVDTENRLRERHAKTVTAKKSIEATLASEKETRREQAAEIRKKEKVLRKLESEVKKAENSVMSEKIEQENIIFAEQKQILDATFEADKIKKRIETLRNTLETRKMKLLKVDRPEPVRRGTTGMSIDIFVAEDTRSANLSRIQTPAMNNFMPAHTSTPLPNTARRRSNRRLEATKQKIQQVVEMEDIEKTSKKPKRRCRK